jgi:hypothetical protein
MVVRGTRCKSPCRWRTRGTEKREKGWFSEDFKASNLEEAEGGNLREIFSFEELDTGRQVESGVKGVWGDLSININTVRIFDHKGDRVATDYGHGVSQEDFHDRPDLDLVSTKTEC